ncbi:MAG: TetR/AcrR family transcriptional regulator [Deltaproteobacteria bacterium]|nr:TetR/AcrR family transcriptional regulator [Candidatus Zymogenaceae bacterium]
MKDTRQNILTAAARVFSENGFHQAKMDDIAAVAGVSKGTLYYNFESKSQLFSATVTEGMDDIIKIIRDNLQSELPFIEHFKKLIDLNVTMYLEYRDLARIIFNEVSSGIDGSVLRDIERVRGRFIDFMSEQLRAGQEDGRIRPCDLRLASVTVTGMIDSLSNFVVRYPDSVTREEIVDFLFSFLARGLLSRSEAEKAAELFLTAGK